MGVYYVCRRMCVIPTMNIVYMYVHIITSISTNITMHNSRKSLSTCGVTSYYLMYKLHDVCKQLFIMSYEVQYVKFHVQHT